MCDLIWRISIPMSIPVKSWPLISFTRGEAVHTRRGCSHTARLEHLLPCKTRSETASAAAAPCPLLTLPPARCPSAPTCPGRWRRVPDLCRRHTRRRVPGRRVRRLEERRLGRGLLSAAGTPWRGLEARAEKVSKSREHTAVCGFGLCRYVHVHDHVGETRCRRRGVPGL
jgi:hypothetical protein